MWEVHYSQEAATYLEDNAALITSLFFAIESLAGSAGKPSVGGFQEVEGIIFWNIQDHLVVLRRMESLHIVRVLFMKPE
ncbi:MAG: hypothetical protein WAU00_01235 [Caldilinea sp.]|nr:hypothetical protein [Anaerolineales bacterium]HRA67833.1 hypothetical protein [Caldilinea sp.]